MVIQPSGSMKSHIYNICTRIAGLLTDSLVALCRPNREIRSPLRLFHDQKKLLVLHFNTTVFNVK